MKRKVAWTTAAACVLLLGTVIVQRWPMAKAQPLPQVEVVFASGGYTIGEADGTVTITVTLAQASSQTVTVDYATSDGTAIAGQDYQAVSGTIVFPPFVTTQPIVIEIIDNLCCEPNKTFAVTLTNPINASIGTPGSTTVTILDNDTCP